MQVGDILTDESGTWRVTRMRDEAVTGCVLIETSPEYEAGRVGRVFPKTPPRDSQLADVFEVIAADPALAAQTKGAIAQAVALLRGE
jgi:hypothetical protein